MFVRAVACLDTSTEICLGTRSAVSNDAISFRNTRCLTRVFGLFTPWLSITNDALASACAVYFGQPVFNLLLCLRIPNTAPVLSRMNAAPG